MNDGLPEACYVMLHIGTGPSNLEVGSVPPLVVQRNRRRFELREDIWIEKLDRRLASDIQRACEPAHHNIKSDEQDRHLYAFVRRARSVALVVSGLEALTSVGGDDLSWQFRVGGREPASELGVDLREGDPKNAYRLRSKLSHGENFLLGLQNVLPPGEHRPLHDRLEQLLRAAVRRCLLDEDFACHFRDDDSVRTRWPVGPKPRS
jgi:hypothetical protein